MRVSGTQRIGHFCPTCPKKAFMRSSSQRARDRCWSKSRDSGWTYDRCRACGSDGGRVSSRRDDSSIEFSRELPVDQRCQCVRATGVGLERRATARSDTSAGVKRKTIFAQGKVKNDSGGPGGSGAWEARLRSTQASQSSTSIPRVQFSAHRLHAFFTKAG
jgi:hypothetical protein